RPPLITIVILIFCGGSANGESHPCHGCTARRFQRSESGRIPGGADARCELLAHARRHSYSLLGMPDARVIPPPQVVVWNRPADWKAHLLAAAPRGRA